MYRSLSKYIVIPNGGHEIVSTINVGFQSLFSFHKSIELPFSYCKWGLPAQVRTLLAAIYFYSPEKPTKN
jgi:hypothetical protein